MEKKTLIEKVRLLFSDIELDLEKDKKEDEVEVKFIEYVAEDGHVLKIAEDASLEAGVAVSMVTPEGEELPVPAGDYVLTQEGLTVTVDENSVIVEVVETPAEESEEAPVEEVIEPAEEEMKSEKELALEAKIKELEETLSKLETKMSAIDTLTKKVEELSQEPASEEVKFSKATGNKKVVNDRLNDFYNFRKNK